MRNKTQNTDDALTIVCCYFTISVIVVVDFAFLLVATATIDIAGRCYCYCCCHSVSSYHRGDGGGDRWNSAPSLATS
jgi:hypothetical protein